ncbi:glycosyltransferase family 4 protein [Pontibacter liquoris]|uniref:glycosyltransferase family 4 protein n=1 Tax=Pontibacter liquoris TaxID=2905677 RepID=UPI001FA7DF04|nr:glycosyltransferase family 4 protein [Pontibacter liquoris]
MRVLKIVNSEDGGGIFTCEAQFIDKLKKKNVVVDAVILGQGDKLAQYQYMCNTTWVIPAFNASYSGSPVTIIRAIVASRKYGTVQAAALARQIKDRKYDAIIYQRPTYIHLAGKLAQLLGTVSLWHLPNTINSSFSKKYYNYYCSKYNIVQVANSIYTKNTLGKQCQYVVYPGFESERVTNGEPTYRAKLGLDENVPVYGMASRIFKDKAQDIVVEAFVNSSIPAAGGHLLVAGGPLDTEFARMIKEKAGVLLNQQVHFLGETRNMPDFYASVDVIINGRRNAEPFGISVAEAMGAAKPVMAYYLGGPSEMLVQDENGWLIQEPTVDAYKHAFDASLASRNKWATMGENAQVRAERFSVESNVDKLIDIISKQRSKTVTAKKADGLQQV